MKKIFKKLALLVVSGMLAVCSMGALTGCGDKNTLKVFLFAQSHEVAAYTEVIRRFEESTGIKVSLNIEEQNYFDILTGDLQAGTASDVFYVRPGDVRSHANLKTVVNLSESGLVTETELDDIWDDAVDFFRYDGAENGKGDIYALPKDYSQYVLGFNKKKIQGDADAMARIAPYLWTNEKAESLGIAYEAWEGVDLTVYDPSVKSGDNKVIRWQGKVKIPGLPGDVDAQGNNVVYTYDEFGALAYLASNSGQHTDSVPANPVYGTGFWEEMCLMGYVWGADGEFLKNNNTQVNFDSNEFKDGYQGFMDLANKWCVHSTGAADDGYTLFTKGSMVFYPVGTWDIGYFDTYANVLEYDIMPWPISNKYSSLTKAQRQDKWTARVDSVGYGIYSQSNKKEEAAKFIKYLSIDPDVQLYLTQSGVQIPNTESVAKGAYLNNEIKDSNGENLKPANKQLLLDIAAGTAGNGHFGPTVYTYNTEWFSEFISGAASNLWDVSVRNTWNAKNASGEYDGAAAKEYLSSYINTYGAKAQTSLTKAIQLEADQKR